jgi:hypothetical protein
MMYRTTSKVMVNGKHGHLFFNDNKHIINNIRADTEYRGANAAIRRQLEAELQAIHDLNGGGIFFYENGCSKRIFPSLNG